MVDIENVMNLVIGKDNSDISAVMDLINGQSINLKRVKSSMSEIKQTSQSVARRVVFYGFLLALFLVTFPLYF